MNRYYHSPKYQRKMQEDKLKALYRHCSLNASEIKPGKECGCFFCLRIFPADEIVEFVDDDQTALCPYCDIDSVIVDGPDVEISKEILAELNKRYFGITI